MTVETNIFETLGPLVAGRCFPDFAPIGALAPFIVYQQAGGEAPTFLERAVPSKENGRFQVTAWSNVCTESKALSKQAEAAMVASKLFDAKPLGAPVALFDEDTELRGSAQDFSVWSDR